MNMRAKICEKNPEFGLPSFEPLIFDKMVVIEEPMVNLYLRNAKVRGICDFIINSVHANLDKLQFNINLTLKRIYMTTMYDVALRLLVPISRIGLSHVTLDNIGLKVSLDMKVTTKNNKKYIYVSK
ncbi:PREDICTED: uncharacterized protein LOC105460080, partial [Wasmannia auropunctata]|uniref:uncharacterized protein LOC105460080 n=1 Tax=Wasmannia auropunctata TaxID=64793 RepID=UPI0005EE39A3